MIVATAALGKLECVSKNIEWNAFKVKLPGIHFQDKGREWLEQELGKLLPLAKPHHRYPASLSTTADG